jgi:hypothetical protein
MTKDHYESLSPSEKVFMDVLLEIARGIKSLREDISRDIEEMK